MWMNKNPLKAYIRWITVMFYVGVCDMDYGNKL